MKLKKLLLIFVSCLLCLSLVSCSLSGGKEEASDTEGELTEDTTGTENADPYLPLYEGDKGVKVIYSPAASSEVINIASQLARSLGRMGIATHEESPAIATDNHDSIEILVGETGYSESEQAYASLGYGEAKACVIGNKVVLVGFNKASLDKAVELFLYAINECKDENGGARIPRDFSETAIINEKIAALPVLSNGVLSGLSDTGDSCYMLTVKEVEKNEFEEYLGKIASAGYALSIANKIENNIFNIYKKGDDALTLMYLENLKTVKMLTEPARNIDFELMTKDTSYVKGNAEVTLTQLGVAYEDAEIAEYYTSGMSYVLRLDNGKFIIIDGGYDKQGDADRIYETMKKQAGSDEVTVAAWIFTHMHSDHAKAFIPFAKTYRDRVTIEKFIYNKPGGDIVGNHTDSYAYVSTSIKTYYPDAVITKAHAGQKYYFGAVEIEMLYSLDISLTALKNYNNSSLVFRINTEDKQIMMMGDYSENSPVLMKIYTAATLKSDVMQVAHHGISDGNNPLNNTVAPEYALWPVAALQIKTYWETNPYNMDVSKHFFNTYFMNMDQSKVFVSGNDVVVMTLEGEITATVYDDFDKFLANTPN